MKQRISYMLFALMLVAVLTACSPSEAPSAPEAPPADREPAVAQTPAIELPEGFEIPEDQMDAYLEYQNQMAEQGRNMFGFLQVAPPDLSSEWESMQFAIEDQVMDWGGKTLSHLPGEWIVLTGVGNTSVLPGARTEVQLTTEHMREFYGDSMGAIGLRVLNPNPDREIPIEEAIIVGVYLGSSAMDAFPMDIFNYMPTSFILPKGLTFYDSYARLTELYGEPDAIMEDEFSKEYMYISDENALTLEMYDDTISSFHVQNFSLPDFVEAAYAAPRTFPAELNEDSYLNVGGYAIHLLTPFSQAQQNLKLVSSYLEEEDIAEESALILQPGEEYTYIGYPSGFDRLEIHLRVYNFTNAPVSIGEASISAVRAQLVDHYYSLEELYIFSRPMLPISEEVIYSEYAMPVTGPFGISLGEPATEEAAKVPQDAFENSLDGQEGGVATVEIGDVLLSIGSSATSFETVISEITLVLLLD